MAARTSLSDKIVQFLAECEVKSEESAYTVKEIAAEFEVSEKAAFDALGVLEDAGKVNGAGRGLTSTWWLSGKTQETPKPKRTRRTKAQMEAARAEEANRTRYNANVAESQDMDGQYATPRVVTPPVVPAETPVKAENGETVTIPVDFDDPSKGRRELDASKGERLISETTFVPRTPIGALREDAPKTAVAVEELRDKLASLAETSPSFEVKLHEPKNGECPEVEIPPLPVGVNANVWEMAFEANTPSARAYWARQAQAQIDEWNETRLAEEHMAEILANQTSVNEDDVPPF